MMDGLTGLMTVEWVGLQAGDWMMGGLPKLVIVVDGWDFPGW